MEPLTTLAARLLEGSEPPRWGIILGSGLGDLATALTASRRFPYTAIPGFPRPTVPGHAGELVLGRLADRPVAILNGRLHFYEGHSMAQVAWPVRLLHALGCRALVVTNSAGGLNPTFQPGDLMAITDHIFLPGLAGFHPLIDPALPPEARFVDLKDAYDPDLRALAARLAADLGFTLHAGVYAMVAGPTYETAAELRLLRLAGADAVGMSTVPEVVVARQLGLRVLGLSCITNLALPEGPAPVTHAEVLAAAARTRPRLTALVQHLIARAVV